MWTVLFLALSTPALAVNAPLKNLVARPSAATLERFKLSCRKSAPLDFHSPRNQESRLLAKARETGDVFLVRGLLYAYRNCSDGASALAVKQELGNEILLQQPAVLIEAVAEEKAE